MTVEKYRNGSSLTVALTERLDTSTAPMLENELSGAFDGVTDLIFDLSKLEYISSAGLRVLLSAQKKMNAQGKMVVCGVNDTIAEIFEITGFSDILTIE